MKTLKIFYLGAFCALSSLVFGQNTTPIKTTDLSNSIKYHYENNHGALSTATWEKSEDSNQVFVYASYIQDGDAKRITYINDAYFCIATTVDLAYCPSAIKTYTDSLYPGFTINKLSYVQSPTGDAYRVEISKGKKKKMVSHDLYFTAKSIFIKSVDQHKLPKSIL
ncbi:MAG: hypothetical protein RRX93_00610 [Bacteroidales bacterium]